MTTMKSSNFKANDLLPREKNGVYLKREIRKGLLKGTPIVMGYLPIGFAFGILAASAGLSIFQSTMMSIMVFAGSAQLIAISLLEAQADLVTLTVTTFLINLRHLLMSAALAPGLGHLSRLEQALFSYQLTDETFAAHSMDLAEKKKLTRPSIFITNMLAHVSWVSSTILGAWAGSLFTDLKAWGLDYALPAMFIALLVLKLSSSLKIAIAVFSLLFSTLLCWAIGGHWYIIITTVAAATLGTLLEKNNLLTPAERNIPAKGRGK